MAQKHNEYKEQPMTRAGTIQGPSRRYRRVRHPNFPAAEWTDKNPLLQRGELGIEKDTHKMKAGDGVTYWNDLPYMYDDAGQPLSTADYQMGNASGGWTTMSEAQQDALNSGATTTNIGQIATNTNDIATNKGTMDNHIANTSNPHSVTKDQVGLGNCDNTSDLDKPISTATQTALDNKVDKNAAITGATKCKITYDNKGLVTGGADLAESDIPALHLSKISDVTASAAEVNVLDGITASTAELNILDGLTATTAELNYVDGVTSSIQTQIDTNKGTMDGHIANTNNPHSVTKAQVGLGNCDNTSDLNKPISTATQTALDGKQAKSASAYNMGNATGGWDAMSTAQQNALNSGATTTNIGQIATNTTNIANEIIDRQNADNGLQGQIDAIVSKSDVVDIVGTYAELQAYDTSTLGNNDVVKVLDDSTHNDAQTYYRWVITGGVGAWVYIGSEAETYTKAETNALLNAKQDTISDLATIRSGAALGATAVQPGDLATVATTGDYDDLLNKPTLGTMAAESASDYTPTASLAAVATSGQYSDLTGTPGVMTGASAGDAGTSGLVPAPAAGDQGKFLQGDGTWANPTAATVWGNITGTLSDQTDLQSALNAKQDTLTAGTNITITSNTISATDTTYTGSDGITLTGTNFTNSGVRSVASGTTNGTISVNTGGTTADVAITGLGSAAYTASSAYATSAQGGKADTAVQPGDLVNYVTTNTTQTISGTKTFTANSYIKNTALDNTVAPSAYTERLLIFTDKNNVRISSVGCSVNSGSTTVRSYISASKTISGTAQYCNIAAYIDSSGNKWTEAPTPAASDNSTKIATTAWCRGHGILIASQMPTSSNNYTWYRKYSDGWVEQGGIQTGSVTVTHGGANSLGTVNLPVAMADSNYFATAAGNDFVLFMRWESKTTTGFKPIFGAYTVARTLSSVVWYVAGKAA